mgnify:CR=1 FL=1
MSARRNASSSLKFCVIAAGEADGPELVVVESDEDVLLYETGHIPGAVKIDWHLDLNDPVTRDYVDGEGFAKLMDASGITRESSSTPARAARPAGPRHRHHHPMPRFTMLYSISLLHLLFFLIHYLYCPRTSSIIRNVFTVIGNTIW